MRRVAARRWLLFGLSLASLLAMTYAGVSFAMSIKVTPEIAAMEPEAKLGSRMLLSSIASQEDVATFAKNESPALLATASEPGALVAQARNVSIGRAMAFVQPDVNGTYEPETLTLRDNTTVNVTALAAGGTGWIVRGTNEPTPRFVPQEQVIGIVRQFQNATLLPALFVGGIVGFLAPLVTIVLTHRGGGPRLAAVGNLCLECRAPMPASADFCTRCGAYARQT